MKALNIRRKPIKMLGDDAISDPNLFLLAIDIEKRAALFVELTRADHKSIAFLDARSLPYARRVYLVDLDELIELISTRPAHLQAPYFIFHTGYSCSTLFARSLERIRGCVVLKEPLVLHQIATYRIDHEKGKKYAEKWETALGLALHFLSRRRQQSDQVIVKADINFLIDAILNSHASKALWLYPSASAFILAVLKDKPRRAWARSRLWDSTLIHKRQDDRFGFADNFGPRTQKLNDAEVAGAFWLSQMLLFSNAQVQNPKATCKTLRSEQFLRHPSRTLSSISSYFHLASSDTDISRITSGNIMQRHSKEVSVRFNYQALTVETQQLAQRYGNELQAGLRLIERLLEKLSLSPSHAADIEHSLEF